MQQVDGAFWGPFLDAAGGIYAVGEVDNGDPAYVCPYQKDMSGILNYPMCVSSPCFLLQD